MKKSIVLCLFALASLFCQSTVANSETSALGACLADALNGKERKELAKWIFLSIAAHPEIKPFSKASPESIEQTNREVGSIVTRILTVDCPVELKRATKNDPMALQTAFEWLGRVAMQELMTNQSVTQAISAYGKYVDQEKVNQLLLSK